MRIAVAVVLGLAASASARAQSLETPTDKAPPAQVEAGSSATSEQNEQFRRAMLDAAERGDAAAIYRIVSAGGSVNVADEALRTPLYMAVMANHYDAVKELLAEGADVNAQARDLASPWLLAAGLGRTEMLKAMSAHHPDEAIHDRFGDTALSAACEGAYPDTVRFLLTLPIDVNHRNKLGWTCLIEIAFVSDGNKAQRDIAELVLAAGADPNIADAHGMTALQHAEARKLTLLANILRAKRGDAATRDAASAVPVGAEPKAVSPRKRATDEQRE